MKKLFLSLLTAGAIITQVTALYAAAGGGSTPREQFENIVNSPGATNDGIIAAFNELGDDEKAKNLALFTNALKLKGFKHDKVSDERPPAQLIILMDNLGEEGASEGSSFALTMAFAETLGLKWRHPITLPHDIRPRELKNVFLPLSVPILVSKNIVSNFINFYKPYHGTPFVDFDIHSWIFYDVIGTQFLLFIPKDYQNKGIMLDGSSLKGLSLDQLMQINYKDFLSFFDVEQLKKIFKLRTTDSDDKDLPIWDIVLMGHGTTEPPTVAGLSIKTMQNLLKFFNKNLYIGKLLIESCGVGGQNSKLLRFENIAERNVPLDLHFTVIILSISDDSIFYRQHENVLKWKNFFQKSKASLSELIPLLSLGYSSSLPQIWVPHGPGFQTYAADKKVKILSKALVAAHEKEDKIIEIPDSVENVLVYPVEINVPVLIKRPDVRFISMIGDDEDRGSYPKKIKKIILDTNTKKFSWLPHYDFLKHQKEDVVFDEIVFDGSRFISNKYILKN